jgi:hypothetical protein
MLTDKAATQAKPKEKLYRLSDGTGNGLSLAEWRTAVRYSGSRT